MTSIIQQPPHGTPVQAGYVVSGPRPTDAIGAALDSAFVARRSLPPDLVATLVKLDAVR